MGTIKTVYNLKQKVYLEDEEDQLKYTITGIIVRIGGDIMYEVSNCGTTIEVHECEVSKFKRLEKDDESEDDPE